MEKVGTRVCPNGETINLYKHTHDELIELAVSPLINSEEDFEWRLRKFIDNIADLDIKEPKLSEFTNEVISRFNNRYAYQYTSNNNMLTLHDEILEIWRHYKYKKEVQNPMGVNMKENTSEGAAFSAAMVFDTKDKTTDEQIKPVPKSDGQWNKYIDNQILPDVDKIMEKKKSERISKIEYYLGIAKAVAARGTCLRRKFGAVIVKDDRIVSTGYVGAPRGRENCCDRGVCFRMENNIPSGTRYELCRSVHAEMNAIINASKEELEGGVLYLVGVENDGSCTPNADCCSMCKRTIINAGIRYVIIATTKGPKTIAVQDWIDNDDSLNLHEGY